MGVELLDTEVVHPLHVLVGVDLVGLDEHAELAGGADLVLDRVDVLHGLRRLVDPLDRVGLQVELVLDGDATEEHDDARHGEGDRERLRQRPEPDGEPAEPALTEVATLRR